MQNEANAKINEAARALAAEFQISLPKKLTIGDLSVLLDEASAAANRFGLQAKLPAFQSLLRIWSELPEQDRTVGRPVLILLIHGIRTQADWEVEVAAALEDRPDRVVKPIKYEFFDAVRFLCPVFTRRKPILRILKELRDAGRLYPGHQLIVIAHSFGTYAVAKILRENSDIQPSILMLCGSVIRRSFRWDMLPGRPFVVVNDCGDRDVWPVLAQFSTWGYGASGRFGFGTLRVEDRFHDFEHSDFLTESFARTYWLPLVSDGYIATARRNSITASWRISMLTVVNLPTILIAGVVIIALWRYFHLQSIVTTILSSLWRHLSF